MKPNFPVKKKTYNCSFCEFTSSDLGALFTHEDTHYNENQDFPQDQDFINCDDEKDEDQ